MTYDPSDQQPERRLRPAPRSGDVVGRVGQPTRVRDEGPTQADIDKFGGVTRPCPECGKDVYDDASMCYHCGRSLEDGFGVRPSRAKNPLFVMIILALVVVMLLFSGVFRWVM